MMNLFGPFLELGFYCGDKPEAETFKQVFEALDQLGIGTIEGATIWPRPVEQAGQFSSPSELENSLDIKPSKQELATELSSNDRQVVQLCINNAIGIAETAPEILTYLRISPDAVGADPHPVVIFSEGEMFSWPPTIKEEYIETSLMLGAKVYERFISLVKQIEPDYASISIETGLECLTDLRNNPHPVTFRDCYVSGKYLSLREFRGLSVNCSRAYAERVGDGIYVSTDEYFNPDRVALEIDESLDVSRSISQCIKDHK